MAMTAVLDWPVSAIVAMVAVMAVSVTMAWAIAMIVFQPVDSPTCVVVLTSQDMTLVAIEMPIAGEPVFQPREIALLLVQALGLFAGQFAAAPSMLDAYLLMIRAMFITCTASANSSKPGKSVS